MSNTTAPSTENGAVASPPEKEQSSPETQQEQSLLLLGDPFVRKVVSPLLVALLSILALPSLLAVSVILGIAFTGGDELWLVQLQSYFMTFTGTSLPGYLGSLAVQVLPAVLGAISFRSNRRDRLNRTGRIAFIVLTVGCIAGIVAIAYLNPGDSDQAWVFEHGTDGIARIEQASEASLRLCVTYLAFLLGLRVGLESEEGKEVKNQ